MPVGRIYQAPTVTVPRQTPVYGFNGLKAQQNNDLLILRGKALSSKPVKAASPDKSIKFSTASTIRRSKSPSPPHTWPRPLSPPSARKSPSPRLSELSGNRNTGESSRNFIRNGNKSKSRSISREPSSEHKLNSSSRLYNTDAIISQRSSQCREKSWSPAEKSDIINNNISDHVDNVQSADNSSDNQSSKSSVHSKNQINADRSRLQNGRDKESGEVDCSKGAGSGATGGTGGLKNLGNTCFMNSVIQCLSNTKLLADYLLSDEYTQDLNTTNSSMKGSLVKAFATMIKSLWKPGARIVDPSSLKGAVQRFAPRFSGYNQEDSQEFLRYLLEGLHEDLNRVATKPQPINSEIDSNLSVHEQGMEAWKRYLRRDDSKLVDIFGGQLKSTLRCSSCDFESVTFEPFWDLSLPIPSRSGEVSLNECLEAFTKEEVMEGDEMPTCGRCKTRRRCTKYYSLYKLPRVLVVHLKRFSPTERFRSKLSTTVTFPLTALDVSRFSDSPGRATYSCYAVSNHSGTLYSGHYTAYARNPKTCEWNYFNDSRVSKSSSSNVISNEAYLLFFELLT